MNAALSITKDKKAPLLLALTGKNPINNFATVIKELSVRLTHLSSLKQAIPSLKVDVIFYKIDSSNIVFSVSFFKSKRRLKKQG